MCGIAGWIDYSANLKDAQPVLTGMVQTLTNRGPDAEGYYLSGHAALGHRRLIVVDPAGGGQPMRWQRGDTTYIIVYNGELYNTEDIRSELLAKDHVFEGWSDTEVLLHAFAEWGEDCVDKLNGIFAFAVWDEKNERLFMARDRIGVKPLFFSDKGGMFAFASELKALLAHPDISPRVSGEGLAEIFALGPARTPGHGVFNDISELRPGWCLTLDREGRRVRQYWSLVSHRHTDDFNTTTEEVRSLVFDAIKRQLVSDVPLCVLLSGGLDSSTIAAIASKVYREERQESIRTFSIDYIDNDKNFRAGEFQPNPDAPWVKLVSWYLGTEHRNFWVDTPDLVESLFPAVLARDLPGMADIDSSLLLFSRFIKQFATVGLSGECADETEHGCYNPHDKVPSGNPNI